MAIIILSAILVFLLTFLGQFYLHRRRIFATRERIGLRGPPTSWLLGNVHSFVERKWEIGYDDGYKWFIEMHRRFGDTFALFVGRTLDIIVSNQDDIKDIFIKNFSNFSDRYVPQYIERSNLSKSLFFSKYSDGWKNCRSAVSPIFSSGSMKSMFGIVDEKVDTLLQILEEKSASGEKFAIQKDFEALTMDVIAKCAFAIDSDCQRDRSDAFYVQATHFVNNIDFRHSWITTAGLILQEFGFLWKALYRFTGFSKAEIPLVKGLNDLYERRVAGETPEGVDLLKLMIDRNGRKTDWGRISQQEIVENCFAVLLGGYDTTSTSLSYCTYLLSRHPDVQEKLFRRSRKSRLNRYLLFQTSPDHHFQGLNYDSIFGMKYLDAVYKESLRVYPPVFHAVVRTCLNDITIRGQLIPKGSVVTATPYTVHRNEENWPNASEFLPERFLDSSDKHSLKWIPFGVGPRICVGMRFAEMEIKTAIVKLVERFEMSMDASEPELVPECEGVVMQPRDPIHVNLRRREEV